MMPPPERHRGIARVFPPVAPPSHPTGWRRAVAAVGKVRRYGLPWISARLAAELREPTTPPGRLFWTVASFLYGAVLTTIAYPIRAFALRRRSVCLFYDLSVSPITYDFVWPLVEAERLRRLYGLDDIKVVVVPGRYLGVRREDDDYEDAVDVEARRWRLHHTIVQLCRLLPTVGGLTVCASRLEATVHRAVFARRVYPRRYWPAFPLAHRPSDILDVARRGEPVPLPLRATEQGLRYVRPWLRRHAAGRRPVVITLRRYHYMPARNSDLDAWVAFAQRMDKSIYVPIFVQDTETALDALPPALASFPVMAEASWNLDLRMALYESAYVNLLVNNGPHGLCLFSDSCRYVMFKILTPSVRQTTEAYMRFLGFEIGLTPPFAGPLHKWVWEDDRLDVIEREFEIACKAIDARSATVVPSPAR